jgi:CRISPR-associated protein (TIGR02584 family)
MDRERDRMKGQKEYPRRVLAMAVGLTPQVVTETLYALAVGRAVPWVPTEIVLITTAEGAQRARLLLLDPVVGHFHRLCTDYDLSGRIRFAVDDVMTVEGVDGPLEDIRTPEENARAADAITSLVRGLCADPEAAVHVSIAGGRKSMGYYLGYALSLFGREQDRLSHVLVNPPFESIPDFFYPPAPPRVVFGAGGRPASSADAVIQLAEIPFVRLREGLPAELLSGTASFVDTVTAASRRLGPPHLRFEAAGAVVQAGDARLSLPPLLWAWYALLADARRRGRGDAGMVRPDDLDPRQLVAFHRMISGPLSAAAIRLEEQLRREGGIAETFFREKSAKLNRILKEHLGMDAARYLVQPRGRRPFTRHGLSLDADQVELPGEE